MDDQAAAFPPEIIAEVLSHANQASLAACCASSSTLLAIAGPLLYSRVEIRGVDKLRLLFRKTVSASFDLSRPTVAELCFQDSVHTAVSSFLSIRQIQTLLYADTTDFSKHPAIEVENASPRHPIPFAIDPSSCRLQDGGPLLLQSLIFLLLDPRAPSEIIDWPILSSELFQPARFEAHAHPSRGQGAVTQGLALVTRSICWPSLKRVVLSSFMLVRHGLEGPEDAASIIGATRVPFDVEFRTPHHEQAGPVTVDWVWTLCTMLAQRVVVRGRSVLQVVEVRALMEAEITEILVRETGSTDGVEECMEQFDWEVRAHGEHEQEVLHWFD